MANVLSTFAPRDMWGRTRLKSNENRPVRLSAPSGELG